MINITTYKEYWEAMANRVNGLEESIMIATEAHLAKKIKDIKNFPLLVSIIPSAVSSGKDTDNTGHKNSGLIFILKKVADKDKTDDYFMQYMEELQLIMEEIEQHMINDCQDADADYYEVMKKLDVKTMNIDPEYNYLECDGWSLSFKFETE